uniref:Uncharacterized protein n=1 Tax=Aegilops tauschii TaxID=37682 RepID=M8BBT9_AEGTA
MKMAQKAKKMTVWTNMAMPLVFMLWNSGRPRPPPPGISQMSPGSITTKKAVAISTGPQSPDMDPINDNVSLSEA